MPKTLQVYHITSFTIKYRISILKLMEKKNLDFNAGPMIPNLNSQNQSKWFILVHILFITSFTLKSQISILKQIESNQMSYFLFNQLYQPQISILKQMEKKYFCLNPGLMIPNFNSQTQKKCYTYISYLNSQTNQIK